MDADRILVVGGDDAARSHVADLLRIAGAAAVVSAASPANVGATEQVALIVACGQDVELVCADVRGRPELVEIPVLAFVPAVPDSAAGAALAAGADDVVLRMPTAAVLGNRVRRMVRSDQLAHMVREGERFERVLLAVQKIMSERGDSPDGIRDALLAAVYELGFERASLVSHVEGSDQAFVIAATDDPTLSKFRLSVELYPEIIEAIRARGPVLIDDARSHPLTQDVASAMASKGIRGVAVIPAIWHGRALGALLLRKSSTGVQHLCGQRLACAQLIAGDVAAHLADGKVMASLREQTHRISRARYEVERRLRAIDTVKAYFDASSDGVVVLDDAGNILLVNRSAEAITGFARDGLIGSPLADLVPEEQRAFLGEVISKVLSGHNLDAFDLEVATTSGTASVSVATSTVLSSNDAVILMFRDVTAERQLEHELTKTKDFLERLIDSTVDAIVAADVKGNIILFNLGAERIYGYAAEEVLGKLPVWKLYPDGVAQQVMRMLRSPSYGGAGRLSQIRREVLTRDGELIPVNMTASVIYEEGHEVATVGIFSDLRERIKIEQRLLQAQEKLMISEKQALVAELAGAAAHELNQPLTSILGYVELILRKMDRDDPHRRYLDTIQNEGERMAEIVKKIGRITRYETKEYVGSASILDLDKSAEQPNGPAFPPEDSG